MGSFNFHCPHCNQKFECEEVYIGQKALCPTCQNELTIRKPPESDYLKLEKRISDVENALLKWEEHFSVQEKKVSGVEALLSDDQMPNFSDLTTDLQRLRDWEFDLSIMPVKVLSIGTDLVCLNYDLTPIAVSPDLDQYADLKQKLTNLRLKVSVAQQKYADLEQKVSDLEPGRQALLQEIREAIQRDNEKTDALIAQYQETLDYLETSASFFCPYCANNVSVDAEDCPCCGKFIAKCPQCGERDQWAEVKLAPKADFAGGVLGAIGGGMLLGTMGAVLGGILGSEDSASVKGIYCKKCNYIAPGKWQKIS